MKCPKCSYERQPTDDAPDWQCPSCKVAYVKVMQAQGQMSKSADDAAQKNVKTAPIDQREADQEEEELQERLWLASKGQKMVIYSILLNFLVRAAERNYAMPDMLSLALYACISIYALVGGVKICSGLGRTQNQKILFMVLSFFPLINIVTFIYLSVKTTKVLREAGWHVGLLGAKA